MDDLVVIDIPEERPAVEHGQGDKIDDDVMVLEVPSPDVYQKDQYVKNEGKEEVFLDPEARYRSYFEVQEEDMLAHELILRPVEGTQPPIAFKATTEYLKWTIPAPPRVKNTHYDIVLGISTKNMDMDAVEAIVVTIHHNFSASLATHLDLPEPLAVKSEVITAQEIKRLCLSAEEDNDEPCFRWKLHEKLALFGEGAKPTLLVMDIKTWQGEPSDYGSIELHYTDILTDSRVYYKDAWMQLPMAKEVSYALCLSWDGSQLVYINLDRDNEDSDTKEETLSEMSCRKVDTDPAEPSEKDDTSFYRIDTNHTQAPPGAIAGSGFKKFRVKEQCPGLDGFFAKAAFHIVATQDQDVKDELFVTCNGVTIEIYSVFGDWSHLRSITMDRAWEDSQFAVIVFGAQLKQLHGPLLVIGDPNVYEVSTWDIEQGCRLSSYMDLTYEQFEAVRLSTAMSKDGRLIAIPGKHHVDIYWTATWTRAASYTVHDMKHDPSIGSVRFIRNDTQIMVDFKSCAPFCQRNHGCIFSVDSMSLLEQYVVDGHDTFETSSDHLINPQTICVGISQVSLFNIEDRIFQSPSIRKRYCQETCFAYDSYIYGYAETLAPSGLTFKAEKSMVPVIINGRRADQPYVTVTVLDMNLVPFLKMPIPLPKDLDFNIHRVNFIGNCSHLVLSLKGLMLIWSTPATTEDKFTLRLAHTYNGEEDWELYGLLSKSETVDFVKSLHDPIRGSEAYFLGGAVFLSEIFQSAGKDVQEDIIQYIGKYVNFYLPGTVHDSNIVQYICDTWEIGTHSSTVRLWKALLAHPTGRWIPRHDMARSNNPILCLLSKTVEHPKAFELAEVFIDYCIRQTKLEKDPHFLLPIRQCMKELTDPKKPYSEVTLELFRELAYIPVRDRDYIVDHHAIAHPYKFHWRFWKYNPRGLHQYQDQVLQVTSTPTVDLPKYIFSRDIYLATFDMLWLKTGADPSHSEDPDMCHEGSGLHSLPFALRALFRRRSWWTPNPTVECHPFEIETLDNPAIAALVEYKWNTIGLQYWLLRFLAQCVYYVLVLIGVVLQINNYDNMATLKGIFISIITMSTIFLWLELFQLIEDKKRYFTSIYNMVDLLAFVFPMAGSILQLVRSDPNTQNSLFSFSVLFIFLHFLFELRVTRSVCKFVSIIIHAIASIRVFFFVFAGGILAFSVAIMHLLHTCTTPECPSFTEGFSLGFFRVISMTYFMMGGMYDSVNNGFTNDDVGFHLMMMIFFFFTVILMLNVLIALINHAIDDGDRTWELDWLYNRMRYIESAENLTYDVPGFRAAHSFFPETIYYTATPLQVREFKKKTQRIMEEKVTSADLSHALEFQVQQPVSGNIGGTGSGGGIQDWGQQQQQQQEESSNGNAGDSAAVLALLKQFQEDQKQAREEQRRVYEEMRVAHEEQRQTANELRKELALLKERMD
ncbi:hypothetical protein BGZ96_000325 [Linnemannia gamsii]|uniref:Ion transport domain-containing protein n=1 Tax=Linnemannia gamsii TaxID=64522 RepID=A0ABQ7JPP5_9FUNG|nr:hypothetical protein BGZ96_000325 [Linnemannia gamsii]